MQDDTHIYTEQENPDREQTCNVMGDGGGGQLQAECTEFSPLASPTYPGQQSSGHPGRSSHSVLLKQHQTNHREELTGEFGGTTLSKLGLLI